MPRLGKDNMKWLPLPADIAAFGAISSSAPASASAPEHARDPCHARDLKLGRRRILFAIHLGPWLTGAPLILRHSGEGLGNMAAAATP
ncbi:hypothetical protein G7046_g4831 [Stylonectria norvegica]|nr:hypothetical protein G7046_g4831 [Stylonectria norvegica]